ncbi:MAG: TetR/AcrR family transcriptional regulator [Gemmatimonadales bacterium]|nr:TetR/AcrR family transcriptional regulator [Gemmatimonadales bacterium]
MSRRPGTPNADHAATRRALAGRLAEALVAEQAAGLSERALARAAGVSVPTLRHYFGDRDGAVWAALSRIREDGEPYLVQAAVPPPGADAGTSVRALLRFVLAGLEAGVGRAHVLGLGAGLDSAVLGPGYLSQLLEPTLDATERRLAVHAACGDLAIPDLRAAAIGLVAPLVVAWLHQRPLGGAAVRRLDLEGFTEAHADAFMRAYAPAPRVRRRSARRAS